MMSMQNLPFDQRACFIAGRAALLSNAGAVPGMWRIIGGLCG